MFSFNFFTKKKPIIKDNTFLIWEPCSRSHAEIVPGFAKYLLDLGYHVSVLITPKRYSEGLFCRFNHENISYNKLSQKQIRKFFKKASLNNICGVLITTVGKLYDGKDLNQAYKYFNPNVDKAKLFFVEHEIESYFDANTLPREDIITLRQMNYKNAKTVVINPHYFGKVNLHKKNKLTKFVSIGALSDKRKSTKILINAAETVLDKGFNNFKITIIGKGKITDLPTRLRPYFDIKGRLDFDKMYDEIEKSDFILSAYEDNEHHLKYIKSKTSGTFQLVNGFLKPLIIKNNFATINGFDNQNAILYDKNQGYSSAIIKAIKMSQEDYIKMQKNLEEYANLLFQQSKENLKNLVNKHRKNITNE